MYQEGSAQHLAASGQAVQPALPSPVLSAQEQQAVLRIRALKDAEVTPKEMELLWRQAQASQTKRRLEWGSVQAFFFQPRKKKPAAST